jgi:hypothetical protein
MKTSAAEIKSLHQPEEELQTFSLQDLPKFSADKVQHGLGFRRRTNKRSAYCQPKTYIHSN